MKGILFGIINTHDKDAHYVGEGLSEDVCVKIYMSMLSPQKRLTVF